MGSFEQLHAQPVKGAEGVDFGADVFKDARLALRVDAVKNSDSPAFTTQQIGSLLDTSADFGNFSTVNRVIARGAQAAYDQGGRSGADKFVADVNAATATDGIGPLISSQDGKLQLHLVEQLKQPPSEQQRRTGEYIQVGPVWYHDLAKPTDISTATRDNADRERLAQERSEHSSEAQASAQALLAGGDFANSGKLTEQSGAEFASSLRGHDRDMAEYIQQVNQELDRRGSHFHISVDVQFNQPGMHGNTVTMYHAQSIEASSGRVVQGFRTGHDTVRGIGPAPALRLDH